MSARVRDRGNRVEPPNVLVICQGCGGERWLSYRRAKNPSALCSDCRWPDSERTRPTDEHRRWWLARFTDEAIAELAEAAFGFGDAAAVRSWRTPLNRL